VCPKMRPATQQAARARAELIRDNYAASRYFTSLAVLPKAAEALLRSRMCFRFSSRVSSDSGSTDGSGHTGGLTSRCSRASHDTNLLRQGRADCSFIG